MSCHIKLERHCNATGLALQQEQIIPTMGRDADGHKENCTLYVNLVDRQAT